MSPKFTTSENTIKSLKCLQYAGTAEEVQEIKKLLQMVASTPTGQKILKDNELIDMPTTLSFVSSFESGIRGRFSWLRDTNTCAIQLLKVATNLPEMTEEMRLKAQILMAIGLAHELQHRADVFKNNQLSINASNINESVVAVTLCEIHAFTNGDQVGKELRAQHDMLDKIVVHGQEFVESIAPPSIDRKKRAFTCIFLGKNPTFKRYMNSIRRRTAKHKYPPFDFNRTLAFRTGVENYLQEMQIPMSYDEVMQLVTQSVKLLPAAKIQSEKRDR